MRTYPLLLVAAVTLSAYVDASSTRLSSTIERPAPSHQHAPRRFLRDGANTTEEERTPTFIKAIFGSSAGKSDEALVAALIPKDFTADVTTNLIGAINFEDKNVLRSTEFETYLRHMKQKRIKEDHSEAQMYVDIARDLDRRYENDYPGLLLMLVKSHKYPKTQDSAKKIYLEFEKLSNREQSPFKYMFDKLKLKELGLKDRNFMLWVKYVTIRCQSLENPGGEWKEIANALEQSYELNEVSDMLLAAYKNKK
ncbi:hypothetical protein KXD40_006366 [Peronospora effusa]|uniref:RxLR effector protein n=1 Tax=Peronospora effusa TaxID=542832 RepID=A0A3M6V6T0_9STRA|nr:hypothetical protein DD238_008546 [Peronospora effusa]RQM10639.1 hypothetical protein DD237_002859 [Peronospora effusa]UIZ25933.1 hypothetical protein KXD40_006366 [Peronospora effusa]